jgi:hypothetical protein
MAGYSDGSPWYLPNAEAYTQSGFEVDIAFCDPQVDRILPESIRRLLRSIVLWQAQTFLEGTS